MLAKTKSNVNPIYIYFDSTGHAWPLLKSKFTANLSPIHVSDYMSGKMSGIPAISTSCLVNPICIKRMQDGESVCCHCFAAATLERYSSAGAHAENNFYLLNREVLPLPNTSPPTA